MECLMIIPKNETSYALGVQRLVGISKGEKEKPIQVPLVSLDTQLQYKPAMVAFAWIRHMKQYYSVCKVQWINFPHPIHLPAST